MKSIIVLSDYGAMRHEGEVYDYIVYVADMPDTSNIREEAFKVKQAIENFGKEEEIKVFCDATPVYFTVVENVVFKCAQEGYNVKISWEIVPNKVS